jgi:hypothetical protein
MLAEAAMLRFTLVNNRVEFVRLFFDSMTEDDVAAFLTMEGSKLDISVRCRERRHPVSGHKVVEKSFVFFDPK